MLISVSIGGITAPWKCEEGARASGVLKNRDFQAAFNIGNTVTPVVNGLAGDCELRPGDVLDAEQDASEKGS